MLDQEFGKRFTDIVEKAGITSGKLTELAGISKNNIGNYKNGQIPNASTLYKLSQILGVSMEYMIAGKEAAELSPEEQLLIEYYRNSSSTGRRSTLGTAKMNSELMPAEQQSSTSPNGLTGTGDA